VNECDRISAVPKIELSDEDLVLINKALRHYHAYTVAKQQEQPAYVALADRLQRKPAESERPTELKGKKRAG